MNFRSAVARLGEDTPLTDDDSFWSEFWKYDTSVDDVFALAPVEDIRRIRDSAGNNLALLCHKLVGKLKEVTDCGMGEDAEKQVAVLNCIRVLTRILPFLFEAPPQKRAYRELGKEIFWTLKGPKCYLRAQDEKTTGASGGNGGSGADGLMTPPPGAGAGLAQEMPEDLASGDTVQSGTNGKSLSEVPEKNSFDSDNDNIPEENRLSEYLGVTLLNSLADMCFMPHFTISADIIHLNLKTLDSREFIWVPGVGSEKEQETTSGIDSNRKEVLQLLLTCFSKTLYVPSVEYGRDRNLWLSYFTGSDCKIRHLLPLFCSLLNVVFSYDPVGMGLPYQFYMFSDDREPLVEVCLTLLIVLLDFKFDVPQQIPLHQKKEVAPESAPGTGPNIKTELDDRGPPVPKRANGSSGGGQPEKANTQEPPEGQNIFINYLVRLHRVEDFTFIERGLKLLLNNPLMGSYFPGSQKKISCHQELMLFFWQLCLYNKGFLYHILLSSDVLEIVVPILHYIVHARKNAALLGMIHVGTFILLVLSGERSFGVRLNTAFKPQYAFEDLPLFTGNHVDLMVLCFHKIITNGSESLFSLYDCMLTIMVNISPYIKSISMISGSKVTHLFEVFSNPRFILAAPGNHHFVFFLLEFCNNIIQYQFDGNANFIYMIIRNRAPFEKLAVMSDDPVDILKKVGTKGAIRQASLIAAHSIEAMSIKEAAASASAAPGGQIVPPNDEGSAGKEEQNFAKSSTGTAANGKSPQAPRPSQGTLQFVPTSEWVRGWKEKLPLQTVLRMLQVLVPQVEQLCIEKEVSDDTEIIEFLRHGTLVGLLPVPHPILIRKYQSHPGTDKWLTSYLWGVVFLRHFNPPVWYGTNIRLFQIRSQPPTSGDGSAQGT
eukprot:Nk52_evm52s242 gene=Nk52_evmTU52s242